MDDIIEALAAQHAELAALVQPLDAAGWQQPSRCEGWTVSDVLIHLAQTDELAIGSLDDRFDDALTGLTAGVDFVADVDAGAGAMVAAQRGPSGPEVFDRWAAAAAGVRAGLAASDPSRRVRWVAGTLSCRTLAATRLAECWIHTGDVGVAAGGIPAPTDRLEHVARLAWRTVPYAFARAGRELSGPVAFELIAPSGAEWSFVPEEPADTVVRGDAAELCSVAGQRLEATDTSLTAEGPDADAVLQLVRTFA